MLGEGTSADAVDPAESHRAFDNQALWKRTLIVAAGPGINFVFAIVLFWMLGMMSKQALVPVLGPLPEDSVMAQKGATPGTRILSVDGKKLQYFGQHDLYIFNQVLRGKDIEVELRETGMAAKKVQLPVGDIPIYDINPTVVSRTLGMFPILPEITTQLDRVLEQSPAATAGLQAGDQIIAIDDVPINSWDELVSAISGAPEQTLDLRVLRGNQVFTVTATPDAVGEGEARIGRLGIGPLVKPHAQENLLVMSRNPLEATGYGVEQTWLLSSVTLRMFWKMVTLQVSHKNISGPITIAEVTGRALQVGLDYYLYILAVISISLGVMNLLPIPMLDGGHLLMYAIEFVAGSDAANKAYAVGQQLGIFLLLCLMSLAFYNDIFRLLN